MKRMLIYIDASVIGGCEDAEFAADSLAVNLERGYRLVDIRSPKEVLPDGEGF